MRLRARTDRNHTDIARTLRQCGAQVLDLSRVGGGCPDLLVSCSSGARWTFVEVKTARGKLTAQQVQFAAAWPVRVVRSIEEAVQLVTALREYDDDRRFNPF